MSSNMQDTGSTAANTANDVLNNVEPIFPWIVQSNNQEDWWLIKFKLVKNTRFCRPYMFFFPTSLISPCSSLSSHYFPNTVFLYFSDTSSSFPSQGFGFCSYLPEMCFLQTLTRFTLLNIQITFKDVLD